MAMTTRALLGTALLLALVSAPLAGRSPVLASTGGTQASADNTPAGDVSTPRLAGDSRIDTAARIAESTFPQPDGARTALLARADDFPDALAAASLAGALDAPILLTDSGALTPRTQAALDALAVERVVLLGGEAALSKALERSLDADREVMRVAGPDRYTTATEIARLVAETATAVPLDGDRIVFVAAGNGFADALAAAPGAFALRQPILLTQPGTLTATTAEALDELDPDRAFVLGGPAAVSEEVATAIAGRGIAVERVAGSERSATAAALAELLVDRAGFPAATALLARGDAFPDALAAGVRAGVLQAPVLLSVAPGELGQPTRDWLAGHCPDLRAIEVIGGEGAITARTLAAAESASEACIARAAITYRVGTVGAVQADVETFRASVAVTLVDDRGWSLGGEIAFSEAEANADLEILLASPAAVAAASPGCSASYSCRVGRRVYINDERWREATPTYVSAGRSLEEYRSYVVNHEVGHYLGLGHTGCPAAGAPAPVMQQQSKGLQGCSSNVWPLDAERDAVRARIIG